MDNTMDITEVTLIEITESYEKSVCRLCGDKSNSSMEDIFDVHKDILEKICSCLPIVILPHDPYPHTICSSCHTALDITARFITTSVATDKNFREIKNGTSTIDTNHLSMEPPLHCDICSTNFTNANLFDKHVEEHKGNMEFSVHLTPPTRSTSCSNCGMSFKEVDAYLQHKTLQVNRCPCGQVFPSKCKLTKHRCTERILKTKLSLGPLKSDISENDSKIHINKNIVDTVISNARKTQEEKRLKSEMLRKKKAKKRFLICSLCSESFSTNKELKEHCAEIHNSTIGDEWICRFCKKSMTTKVGLIIHERIHDGTKPYICEWCGKGFRSRANLTQHQVIHTGVRKYPCPRCNKRFTRRSFVETHMRVHTGERPYCCDICGYRFTQIGDMRRHRNKHQTYPGLISTGKSKSDVTASE